VGRSFLLQLGLYPKGALPVKGTSQTRVSVVLASTNLVMLLPVSFGFPTQNTENSFILNYHNSKWLQGSGPPPWPLNAQLSGLEPLYQLSIRQDTLTKHN